MISYKKILYRFWVFVRQSYWRTIGGRTIGIFGVTYKVTPETEITAYRTHKLPKAGHKSRIVRYTDFVQLHAIVDYIERLEYPPTVIDVGAHHGAYAVLIGSLLGKRGGRCIAIEPNPESYNILKTNVKLNNLESVVTCIQAGVSDTEGVFYINDNGIESKLIHDDNASGLAVNVRTLSQVINEQGLTRVDILLVDVEGAELPVLQGFPWSSIPAPRIFCELHPYAWSDFGYTGLDLSNFFAEKDFRCIDMFFNEYHEFNASGYIGPTVLLPSDRLGMDKINA